MIFQNIWFFVLFLKSTVVIRYVAQMNFLICSTIWLLSVHLLRENMSCWGLRSADGTPDRPHSDPKYSWDTLQRQKRNWVWNQFFVLEEYTGTDPLYVGKVRFLLSFLT